MPVIAGNLNKICLSFVHVGGIRGDENFAPSFAPVLILPGLVLYGKIVKDCKWFVLSF